MGPEQVAPVGVRVAAAVILLDNELSVEFNEALNLVPEWMFAYISQMLSSFDFELFREVDFELRTETGASGRLSTESGLFESLHSSLRAALKSLIISTSYVIKNLCE